MLFLDDYIVEISFQVLYLGTGPAEGDMLADSKSLGCDILGDRVADEDAPLNTSHVVSAKLWNELKVMFC